MSQKTKITALMIIKIILVAVGLLFWFVGFTIFNDFKVTGSAFGGWICWGFVAAVTLPFDFLSNIAKGARDGEREGANTFKVKDYGSTFSIANNPTGGALRGIITSLVAFILVGPLALSIKIFCNLLTVISCIITLRQINANNN